MISIFIQFNVKLFFAPEIYVLVVEYYEKVPGEIFQFMSRIQYLMLHVMCLGERVQMGLNADEKKGSIKWLRKIDCLKYFPQGNLSFNFVFAMNIILVKNPLFVQTLEIKLFSNWHVYLIIIQY